jgi:hypothetical protein
VHSIRVLLPGANDWAFRARTETAWRARLSLGAIEDADAKSIIDAGRRSRPGLSRITEAALSKDKKGQSMKIEAYLGDGLYASFDGYQINLRAPREGGDHWVSLNPDVFDALMEFRAKTAEVMKRGAAQWT